MMNSDIWKKKAVAFVTRSHRHLWGKNNEDPLAFLFLKGLENQFAKNRMIGWNKFGQERPIKNWGIKDRISSNGTSPDKTFLLPSGIVIPYIVNKELISVFIVSFNEDKTSMVPGSQSSIILLNGNNSDPLHPIVMVANILDGLYLYQETRKKAGIIVCPTIDDKTGRDRMKLPLDKPTLNRISKAETIQYFHTRKDRPANHIQRLELFSNITDHLYKSKEELVDLVNRLSGDQSTGLTL